MKVFSQTQFRKHFQSIREDHNLFYTKERLEANFVPLLKEIEALEYGWLFAQPVDAAAYDLAHYSKVIAQPMDLSKIRSRILQNRYTQKPPAGALRDDIVKVFENAIKFSKPAHMVRRLAEEYLEIALRKFEEIVERLSEEEVRHRNDPNHCAICGGGEIALEPVVLWCIECGCRIPHKAAYYMSPMAANKQTCESCYRRLHNKDLKATLRRQSNIQQDLEPWIECEKCKRWVHGVCSLLNASTMPKVKPTPAAAAAAATGRGKKKEKKYKSKAARERAEAAAAKSLAATAIAKGPQIQDAKMSFTCPLCVYNELCQLGAEKPLNSRMYKYRGANFLPENRMTRELELHLDSFLRDQMRQKHRELGDDYDPTRFAKVKVRCVSNIERQISEATTKKNARLFAWLREQNNYRLNFKGRSKMILLFQEHGGVDIVFFAMYVQEYDEETAHGPNKKTCYISYLDSVKYFRPVELRTQLYYELLLSYFKWVKKRGFTRCYIWVCPPNEKNGDDYILYCHPKSQQTPTEDRLRTWYRKMVIEGHKRKIVAKCQSLMDAHIRDATDCTSLPFFSGDYWPQIAEIIIQDLPKPPASTRKISHSKSYARSGGAKATPTGTRRGTRSTETQLVGALANVKQRDPLVKKLNQKLGSNELKDNFLVIDFFDTCSHCNKFITHGERKWTCKTCNDPIDDHWAEYTFKRGLKGLGSGSRSKNNYKRTGKGKGKGKGKSGQKSTGRTGRAPRLVRTTSSGRVSRDPRHHSHSHEVEALTGEKDLNRKKDNKPKKFVLCDECHTKHAALEVAEQHPVDDFETAHELVEEKLEPVFPSTREVDEELSSEIFNEREDLLTLCQTNKYQFDQIRRAKHSTMMFLYHIFNIESIREALPATCDECGSSIQGAQYRCKTCPDYDMCMSCHKKRVVHKVGGVAHELRLHDPASERNMFIERRIQQTRAQYNKRLNDILVHAATCTLSRKRPNPCKYGKNCYKLVLLLEHYKGCKESRDRCAHCRTLTPILQRHYKVCRDSNCKVPGCIAHQPLYRSAARRGAVRMPRTPAPPSTSKAKQSRTPIPLSQSRSSTPGSTNARSNGKGKGKGSATLAMLSAGSTKKRKATPSMAGLPKVKHAKGVSV